MSGYLVVYKDPINFPIHGNLFALGVARFCIAACKAATREKELHETPHNYLAYVSMSLYFYICVLVHLYTTILPYNGQI